MQITEQKNIILIKECKDVKTVSVTKETNGNVNCMNITYEAELCLFDRLFVKGGLLYDTV